MVVLTTVNLLLPHPVSVKLFKMVIIIKKILVRVLPFLIFGRSITGKNAEKSNVFMKGTINKSLVMEI